MKKHIRRGKYTKQPKRTMRSANPLIAKWQDWKQLPLRKKIAVVAVPSLVMLLVIPLVTYIWLARDIADPERLMNRSNTGVQILDKDGEVLFSTDQKGNLKRLTLGEISDYTEKALVSSEDKDFYTHAGVSVGGMLRAIYTNIFVRDDSSGGSTITQQLVKNTLLSSERTVLRKYQEMVMAVAVERTYTKDEILDMYLNSIYYGEGAFGIDEAAKVYFAKSAAELSLAESTMLIGIIPAPSEYSPISGDAAKAKIRQSYVLQRMVEDSVISAEQKAAAEAEVLSYAPPQTAEKTVAPHFIEMVLEELYERYGEEKVKRSGYKVTTTLNQAWQTQAEAIVAAQAPLNAQGGGTNAALVAIEPKTGAVRALIGSVDYDNTEFGKVNMATTARQPGSSFKPIYIAEAIDQKLVTAATILRDEATDFGGYAPNNYDFKFRGDITLRNALAQSLNIPAVKVMEELGVSSAVEKAREMGLTTISEDENYGLSLALGSAEVTPLAMTSAYSAFANEGKQASVGIIESINNKYNETIYTRSKTLKTVQSSSASFIISDVLSDNTARSPTFGSSLTISGRDVAVKTGSTDNNHDAWTIGYTPSIAVGVWVGNNENVAMTSGGSAMAGPIWRKSITAFLEGAAAEAFSQPSSVVQDDACSATKSAYKEFFISGTQPSSGCTSSQQDTNDQSTTTKDTDGDGVKDSQDQCASTPAGTSVDANGCPKTSATRDTDRDGVVDSADACPATPTGEEVDETGCAVVADDDEDGVVNSDDECPNTAAGVTVGQDGCPLTIDDTPVSPTGYIVQRRTV